MNRSILIVICDFLLVSLLAFSTVDINKVANPGAPATRTTLAMNVATNQAGGRQDLGDIMRLALDEERKSRESLQHELAATRDAVGKQQADLSQREAQIQAVQQQLQAQRQHALQLESEQTNLLKQVAAAQANIQNLNQQLQATSTEVALTKEERAALEAKAREQAQKSAALQQQLAQLQQSNQTVVAEKEKLSAKLQLSETERNAAAAQLARAEDEVKVRRDENAKLADGVQALAAKSSELVREIRENTPLAANNIFEQLSTNLTTASFYAFRTGVFGLDSTRYKQTQTVLVSDGTNAFALCHVQDTPLTLWAPGTQWQELTGTLAHNSTVCPISSVWFYLNDPRVVLIPVTPSQVKALGCKICAISSDPYKFQDAIIVGARQGYYGECKFQIDLSTPLYLKMDHNSLKGLFGKFNPSSGDLVFSKTGELLGVMANSVYCVMLHKLEASAILQFGPEAPHQRTADTLSSLYSVVASLPPKLQ